MKKIPDKLREELAADPFYKVCARAGYHSHVCKGRITWEHTLIYANNQVQTKYAIIPLCEFGHAVNNFQDSGDLKKEINIWIALNRATDQEIKSISKAIDYSFTKQRLNKIYGEYDEQVAMLAYNPAMRQISSVAQEEKKVWYLVNDEIKKLVENSIEWHRENEGIKYTTPQMIEEMIRYYNLNILNQ